ncbi:MAG: hypothetical protein H0U60_18570 [Blastocatellia bacterium]|nr:hypothetical protein [Blastocatellia bacterium]
MDKIPYAHLSTDVLDKLPFLASGSNAVVFMAIGILLPMRPNGPKVQDLINATALSARTIQAALTLLINNGMVIETSGGEFTPAKHIDYRGTSFVRTAIDQSINRQSNQNQSSSVKLSTEKEFGQAYSAVAAMLQAGGGVSPATLELFGELWDAYPDLELHRRAVAITLKRAARPNYKYYAAVVQSGAVDSDAKENGKDAAEVRL